MPTLATQITIDTPAETVWKVLTDFPAYPQWNDFIIKIEGTADLNNQLEVHIQTSTGIQKVLPQVVKNVVNHQFEWIGKLPLGAFQGHHCFEIIPQGPQQVLFIHQEHFSGWMSRLLLALIGKQTKAGFERMNQALKAEAEKLNSIT